MRSCIYEGHVRHTRHSPVRNEFRYRMFQMYLDLDELDEVFGGRWLWSHRRPSVAWFRRADFLGDPDIPLAAAVRGLVGQRTGVSPRGPVRLLTHLRYFGYSMNPVSFYYCFGADGDTLEFVVAEINNTPWNERFAYVLDMRGRDAPEIHRFQKRFHVSPFMDMNVEYAWRFSVPDAGVSVHMENLRDGRRVFDAVLELRRRPVSTFQLARVLALYPFMTARVMVAIYWQALRLWIKHAPFYPHPKYGKPSEVRR